MTPDGGALFISTESCGVRATFTFDADDVVWRKHGDWKLPFKGQAVFDPALDAWVGLSGDKRTLGHLCSCDVAPISSDASSTVQPLASDDAGAKPTAGGVASTGDDDPGRGSNPPPAWKLCKEKLFCQNPAEKHHGAALVYMGGKSKFCLLQCVYAVDENEMDSDDDETDPAYRAEEDLPRRHVLQLTTITLKYEENGQLRTAKRRRVRCYQLLPHARPLPNDIRAFWI
uniref:Uncharacterized protein n=1 Tax=Aegilops tauschii TaxID=37682 RepID=M8BJ80_AEGTA